MGQLNAIGWITSELTEGISASGSPYIWFFLAEPVRIGSTERMQYYWVLAPGDLARQLARAHVKKGSLLWVSGSLELEEYTRKGSATKEKRLKLFLTDRKFVPGAGSSKGRSSQTQDAPASEPSPPPFEILDGERNTLPE